MADLRIAVEIVAKDLASQALKGVEGALGDLGKASVAAKQLLPGVGIAAAGLTAGLASTVSAAAGFEQKMSAVGAVSGATAGEMRQLSGLALKLGKDTSYSASEAAGGLEELVKGGLTIPDIMNGAATATLNLAAAGGVSLPDAATIAANALAQFNLKGEDMAHVADLIAGAANASALDVGQFKFSLQAAGAVASTVGFSFDDLAQAIAVMGKAGITGSDAGTSLKTMMLNLQPSTKAQVAEFERLGLVGINTNAIMADLTKRIEGNAEAQKKWAKEQKDGTATAENLFKIVQDLGGHLADIDFNKYAAETGNMGNAFFDASGKVKSMADVAGILQNATKDMTEQQKLASLEILFGSDAIRAAAVLSKEGAAGFQEMAGAMGKVTAAAVGAQKLDNLNGSIEQLKGSVETLQIELGQRLIPLFRPLIDGATAAINAFLGLSDQWKTAIAVGLTVATGLAVLTTAVLALLAVLPAVIAGFGAVAVIAGVVAGVLTGPVLLAVGAVVGASVLLHKGWTEDWGGIQEKTAAVWGWLSENVFAPLGAELGRFTAVVLPELAAAWQNVTAIAQAAWAALVAFLQPALVQLSAQWGETWEAIKLVLTLAWGAIKLEVSVAWEVVQGVILAGLKVLQGDWRGAWDVLREHLGNAWELMKGATAAALQALLEAIVGWAGQAWDAMRTAGLEMVKGILNGLGGLKDELTKTLTDAIAGAIAAAKNAAAGAAAAVGGAVKGAAGAATAAASGGFDWATYNFEKNMGASDEEARKKAGGKGAGPPLLGGDAGVLGGAAVQRGMALLGNQAWDNFCQQFVDDLLSPGVRYPTAWATAQARMTNPGGTLANAPYGSVVWFKPDPTNAFAGHVGFSLGDGRFLSALPTGVAVQNANAYWSSLFAGWGPAYRQLGGPVREGRPYVVGEAGPELFVPQTGGTVVPNDRLRSGTPAIDYDRLASAVLAGFSGARVALDATSGENFVVFHLDGARRRGRL